MTSDLIMKYEEIFDVIIWSNTRSARKSLDRFQAVLQQHDLPLMLQGNDFRLFLRSLFIQSLTEPLAWRIVAAML
jgi:hypothetical protein